MTYLSMPSRVLARVSLAAAALALFALAGGVSPWRVLAQTPQQSKATAAEPSIRPQGRPLTPRELEQMFDAYVLIQAESALELNETQYPQFVSKQKILQEQRRQHQRARNQHLQELRKLMTPPAQPDESLIRKTVEALRQLEGKHAEALQRAYEGIDQVLDVRQQARFRLFEDRMETRKLELVLEAREAARLRRRAARGTGSSEQPRPNR